MRMTFYTLYVFSVFVAVLMLLTVISGCATSPVVAKDPIKLSWDKPQEWSDTLTASVKENLESLSKASDITKFCPKFKTLSNDKKVKAISEIFVGMSKHESNWKPETSYRECSKSRCRYGDCFVHKEYGYCMKGNPKYDGGVVTSRGLLQMSISSSLSYGCDLKDSNELHDPNKNLNCAVLIMKKLVEKRGEMTTSKNYWSTMKSSYSGNHIKDISDRVKKYAEGCN